MCGPFWLRNFLFGLKCHIKYVLEPGRLCQKLLTRRVNGLAMISSRIDFRTKLMVANGFVMSKVCYLVHIGPSFK